MVSGYQFFSPEEYRLLQECVHCGLCLGSCPTYMVNGREADSPRGRLSLMKYLDEDSAADTGGAYHHIDLCLGCLACQTACPSGVRYSQLLEKTRSYQRREVQPLGWSQRLLLRWFTERRRLGLITALVRLVQRTGLDRLVRSLRLLPPTLRFQLAGLPKVPNHAFSRAREPQLPAVAPDDQHQGAVALFTGCVMDHWYGEVHAATARILRWNGFDVALPEGQTCCGALHVHAGLEKEAEHLLARNRDVFMNVDAQALVVDAAGCGAQLRTSLWPDGDGLPVVDVFEWLATHITRPPRYKLTEKISYDAPCHLHHAQSITEEPYRLLELACEQLTPLPEAEMCCGSAGLYSLVHGNISRQVLARKIDYIRFVNPAVLVTGNPGCQLQLQAGLREAGIKASVRHAIQVLDNAYRRDEDYRYAFELAEDSGQL
ncbi:MAG: (Fe-S)-binding protein [Fidelibacterota bacterium]|nr:MAG: (Fe-S)-binding protein [Candidatus Neomarinimicrobiota bacterium]